MYMLIYDRKYKNVIARVEGSQDLETYLFHMPSDTKKLYSSIYMQDVPENYRECKVIGDGLKKMTEAEVFEIRQHKRILTEDERLLESLIPSIKEVQKAESEIEVLTLLNEVDVI